MEAAMKTTYTIEELKRLKENYGLTYEDIQKKCALSISTIQKAFGGINKHPRLSTLEELSKAFDLLIPLGASHTPVIGGATKMAQGFRHFLPEGDPAGVEESPAGFSKGSSALKNSTGKTGGQEIYTQRGYTYNDYLQLKLPEGKRVEIIDGVVYDLAAPTLLHQDIAGYFYMTFSQFIRKNKGVCKPYISPVDVRLDYDSTDMTVVQPDMFVICDRSKVKDGKAVHGAPDFILEVISHSSRKIDTNLKLKKYRETGVREYWIVDYESGVVIKNVFPSKDGSASSVSRSSASDGEWTKIYTTADVVPVEIYDGALEIDFNDLREFVEA